MPVTVIRGDRLEPLEVLIAGGGVAALEALLALRSLAGRRVRVTVLAPDREFVYRPLSVGEPFGLTRPRRIDLERIVADNEARYHPDTLSEVDAGRRVVLTGSGEELGFGALVVAVGARASEALPGALAFAGGESSDAIRRVVDDLAEGVARSVAFAVPPRARWPLPVYELALLTAGELRRREAGPVRITLVTPEGRPLGVFPGKPSVEVEHLLDEAGIELIRSSRAEAVGPGELQLVGGRTIPAERVVTLPQLDVPDIPGIPQGVAGFIPTDPAQRVQGMVDVYAVGDATWFPIKHGGIAAQQADTASAAIAAGLGVEVDPSPEGLILRAALITGSATRFLSATLAEGPGTATAASAALWWPPGKVAGRYLAPYLALHLGEEDRHDAIRDLSAAHSEDPEGSDAAHREALELALAAADADAGFGDYATALRWLQVAEQLNVALPPEYAGRREEWENLARSPGSEG